jgi:RHS repeat-associated protein
VAGFTGKEGDEEVGLVYFGERYLIPRIGRWASPDPLHIWAAEGGEALNAFHYVAGDLLASFDAFGLNGARGPKNLSRVERVRATFQRLRSAVPVLGHFASVFQPAVEAAAEAADSAARDSAARTNSGSRTVAAAVQTTATVVLGTAAATGEAVAAAHATATSPVLTVAAEVAVDYDSRSSAESAGAGGLPPDPPRLHLGATSASGGRRGSGRRQPQPPNGAPASQPQAQSAAQAGTSKASPGGALAQASEAEIDAAVDGPMSANIMIQMPAPVNARFNISNGMMVNEHTVPARTSAVGETGNVNTRVRVHTADPSAPPGSNSATGNTVTITQGNGRRRMLPDGSWHHTSAASDSVMDQSHIPIHRDRGN